MDAFGIDGVQKGRPEREVVGRSFVDPPAAAVAVVSLGRPGQFSLLRCGRARRRSTVRSGGGRDLASEAYRSLHRVPILAALYLAVAAFFDTRRGFLAAAFLAFVHFGVFWKHGLFLMGLGRRWRRSLGRLLSCSRASRRRAAPWRCAARWRRRSLAAGAGGRRCGSGPVRRRGWGGPASRLVTAFSQARMALLRLP